MAPLPKGKKAIPIEAEKPRTAADILREKAQRGGEIMRSSASGPPGAEETALAGEWLKREGQGAADKLGHNLRAAGAGFSANALPYAMAAGDVLAPVALGQGDLGRTWDEALRRRKKESAASVAESPGANIAGAVLQPTPYGKAGVLSRMVGAGGVGALSDYLGSDSEDPRRLEQAAQVGGYGAGVQGAAEVASPLLGKYGKALRQAAGTRAVQAAGTRAGITDALRKMGVTPDDVPDLGNRMLDEGLIPSGLNPLRNPVEETAKRAQALQSKSGANVGRILDDADAFAAQRVEDTAAAFEAAQKPGFPGALARGRWEQAKRLPSARFDYDRAAQAVEEPLSSASAAGLAASGRLRQLGEQVRAQGQLTPGSFRGANKLKSDAYRSVDWKAEAPLAAELHRKGTSGLRRTLEEQVGEGLGQNAAGELISANRSFGTAADAEALGINAISRDLQKQPFPLQRAAILAAGGAGAGSLVGGPGTAAGAGLATFLASGANNVLLARGPNIAAHLDRAGSVAAPLLGGVVNQTPAAAGAAGNLLENYLRPKDDEEREEEGAAWFAGRAP